MSQDTPSAARAPKRRHWLRWILLAVLLLLVGGATYGYNKVAPYARIGGTYIAKQYCSCLFVTGRSEASCKAEFKPDIDRFTVSVDRSGLPAKATVKTRLAIFSAEATYEAPYGCRVGK